jgi:hypothetical protein
MVVARREAKTREVAIVMVWRGIEGGGCVGEESEVDGCGKELFRREKKLEKEITSRPPWT